MDEYLFLTVAKLKADRLRLERAERRRPLLRIPAPAALGLPVRRDRPSVFEKRRDARPKPAPQHPIFSLVSWR